MDELKIEMFPRGKTEALTMLYLSNQDLCGISASELVRKYDETYNEIANAFKELRNTKRN